MFQNRSIDLCGIMPPNGGLQVAQHPFHLVHEIIHCRSLFFETILEADDGLSNELWLAICQQADLSFQPTVQSADSVLMQTVSFYVTRLLPTEPTAPSVGRVPLVTEIGHRKHTPLDLFLPTSPVVIISESQEFFSSSLHPRHLTIFCNFVSILCTTSDFPSANRLMMLRYLLKQFHVFCLYDVADQDMLSSLHCRPPFSAHLYTFLYTFLEQCPTASIFKDFVQCWMTFCRPWRYADALLTLSSAEFLRGPWMPFIRVHEKFYRILLGKILRRVAVFDLNMESIKVIRAAVEFSWKEPMVSMLRVSSNFLIYSALPNRTPQLSETPKRAPTRLLPDHVRDPVTGLMYLTELGRRQVWSGERRFDFSMCSQLLPQWKSLAKPYEFPPLVVLLTKINEYLNRTALVSTIASEYSKDTVLGSIARTIMDPPCPNPSSPLASPVFSKTIKVTPPALRIRNFMLKYGTSFQILANYGVLLGLFIVFLFARYGIWALIPVLLTSFICAMFLLAAEDL
ncbi:unnamed protein product [Haemonchus placei]|uniref:Uncharacterized protein n=1 Tax=Haemonchus placei TaxID=6290 RepID=A0A3P7WNG3_HAEPC|nr:unnamed protein product [Haemonchus placei]